jgi:D-tyrosyl-tRNA(Tyr) deacylase
MKAVVQRVKKASVSVDGETIGAIDHGMCIFVGVLDTDTEDDADWLAKKAATLRIFHDEQGKMSRDIFESKGQCLVVSQFTLVASCMKGKRPDFTRAAEKERAKELYERFLHALEKTLGKAPETGRFQAKMQVSLVNDGPVTFIIES